MTHKLTVGLLIFAVIFITACSLEENPELLRTIVPGDGLTAKLKWLQDHAAGGRTYNVEVDADENIKPFILSYSGRSKVTVRLHGDTTKRTVDVSGSGSLFTVSSGVTLILDNNIILKGHSGNDAPLVTVYGALVMRKGSLITGNTAFNGGGVYVDGGTFTMEDGEIAGNTAYKGGGVYIENGKFIKIGGTIYGYASNETNSNISSDNGVVQEYRGHAVYAVNKILAKRKEITAGPNDSLSFDSSVNPPAWSGEWDDDDDFNQLITMLVSDIWVDGEITTKYDHNWYSINVTGGTEYYIWWHDADSGTGVKSMDVDVYAYYSDGTPIYLGNNNSAWDHPVSFTARSNGTVYIRVRANNGRDYTGTYGIVYSTGSKRPSIIVSEGSLAGSLEWIKLNTTGGDYTIEVTSDETIDPQTLNYDNKAVTITLIGDGTERLIYLSGIGSMFTVGYNVMLILDNNITLLGHSDNYISLIWLEGDGGLIMNTGSKITGNNCGGVYVNDGTFTMNGGEIYGNTASDSGGGVYVSNYGTFTMNGGEIYGNTALDSGGGVYVSNYGTFTKTGGNITGYDSYNGSGDASSFNMVMSSGFPLNNRGHAVYVYKGGVNDYRRETTAGLWVNLDSGYSGTAGGWEN
jgi:hypothetical protein